jgi:hypothetical protein
MGACPAGPTGPTLKPGEFVGLFESAAMVGKGRQACEGAPWAFKAEDVAAYRAQNAPRRPLTADPAQQRFDFQ